MCRDIVRSPIVLHIRFFQAKVTTMTLLAASLFASIFLGILSQNLSPLDYYRNDKLIAVAATLSSGCQENLIRCGKEYWTKHQNEVIDYCNATRSSESCLLEEVVTDGKQEVCNGEEYSKLEPAGCTCVEEFEAFNSLVQAYQNLESQGIPQGCLDRTSTCNNDTLPLFRYLQPYCDFLTQQGTCLRSNESSSCSEEIYNNWLQHTCKLYCIDASDTNVTDSNSVKDGNATNVIDGNSVKDGNVTNVTDGNSLKDGNVTNVADGNSLKDGNVTNVTDGNGVKDSNGDDDGNAGIRRTECNLSLMIMMAALYIMKM